MLLEKNDESGHLIKRLSRREDVLHHIHVYI